MISEFTWRRCQRKSVRSINTSHKRQYSGRKWVELEIHRDSSLIIFCFSIYLPFSRISHQTTFAVWLWQKMSLLDVSRWRESSQHQTATSIFTSRINRDTTTTCWTPGNIATVKSVRMASRCCVHCAGSGSTWKFHRRLFRRYVDRRRLCVSMRLRAVTVHSDVSRCYGYLNFYYFPFHPSFDQTLFHYHSLNWGRLPRYQTSLLASASRTFS